MASLNIAGVPTPPSNTSGFNRSRRSSWSDSKNVWNIFFYRKVKRRILAFQSLTTGLFPTHLDTDKIVAHVVENIFCAIAVWSLRQCYCKIDNDQGRAHELGQAAVKCMRGKRTEQSSMDALHSKFSVFDGSEIEGADEVGQLQICAVSIYLLTIVQMITSNLQIIFSMDEVNFVQQLIFSIERAYRTPDYGIWERGTKYNTNTCELHASSIGMAKAALESMNGFNLYGDQGSNWSVVYVDDAHNRNRTTFDTLLPRESASKNTDVALLLTVGIFKNNQAQVDEYLNVLNPLLRRTVEVRGRMSSTSANTECEPLKPREIMVHYYYIDHSQQQSSGNSESSERSNNQQSQFVSSGEVLDGNVFLFGQAVWIICQLLVDKLLTVSDLNPIRRYLPPCDRPKLNSRYSSIQDASRYQYSPSIPKLITTQSYDTKKAITRTILSNVTFSDLVIHVVAISESVRLQQVLATYGIQTQIPKQIEPILIWPPAELVKTYAHLGMNEKFGFSGRPKRPIGVLGTCKVYRIASKTVLCYPLTFETTDFYMSSDMTLLLDDIRSDLEFITKCWRLKGRPIYLIMLREGPQKSDVLELLTQIRQGKLSSTICVRLERLQTAISSACIEHLDFLNNSLCSPVEWEAVAVTEHKTGHDSGQYKSLTDVTKSVILSDDIDYNNHKFKDQHEIELLAFICNTDVGTGSLKKHTLATYELYRRGGIDLMIRENYRVRNHLESLMKEATTCQNWAVIRFASSLLHKMVDSLAPSVTNLLVRGKIVTIGVFGQEETVIDKPMRPKEIFNIIYSDKIFGHSIFYAVLLQELLLNTSVFMNTFPQLFNGILKIRLGWILEAMKLELESSRTDNEEIGQPILSDMTDYELNFSLKIEEMLGRILDPAYRCLVVEMFESINVLLQRNPELCFVQPLDVDYLISDAIKLFEQQTKSVDPLKDFYNLPISLVGGSTGYMIQVIINYLFSAQIQKSDGADLNSSASNSICKIS
ncbi:unnamed protein product [Rotaria magnacalcarata]|uniref:Phosphorylase b kinase regulatory subunit n=1 Tax=Rotaria magnacalcarata TaxID=392030 RepID=A0A814ZVX8_9BILA|nr:unnamed protein product [Rotaria magnacalcarata]